MNCGLRRRRDEVLRINDVASATRRLFASQEKNCAYSSREYVPVVDNDYGTKEERMNIIFIRSCSCVSYLDMSP